MNYTDKTLTFESDKIYFTEEETQVEVMMDWEHSLMSASAVYVCEGGGDILEIGFGMGISAGYIQSQSISSHNDTFNIPNLTWQEISIDPPSNSYFNSSVYYLPKKQF
jgi:hypothetical protein